MSIKIQKRGGVVHNGHRDNGGDLVSNCGSGERYTMGSLRQMSGWVELPEGTETTCKKCKKQADEAERLGLHLTVVENENGSRSVVDTRNETVAEQAAYIEEGIEIDEADAAEHAHGEQVAITKYSANEAIATAVFEGRSVGGHVTRERGRWVLRAEGRTIRAKTLGKVARQWAKKLGFFATTITVETMS